MQINSTLKNFQAGITKTVLDKKSLSIVFLSTIGIFALLYLIPVWTTPGNSIAFAWSIMKNSTLFLMITLSIVNGLVLGMQFYIYKNKQVAKVSGRAKHATTFFGMIISSLAATMACAACYSSILAVLGLGGSAFVVTHRWWFASFAIGLGIIAMHFATKKIAGGCKSCDTGICKVENKKPHLIV